MPLDKIDNNKDKKITHQELEKAVKEGFFDEGNNLVALTQQVKKEESRLLESFRATLTQAYTAIRTKKTITQDDQKIIDLYNKLSPALSIPTPNLYANAPSSKPWSEIKEPNINNITYNFDTTCRELTHWAQDTYPQAYNAMIKNMEKKHSNKTAGERQDYIRYESIVRALEAYYKKLDADNSTLLKKYWFHSTWTITDSLGKKETVESFGWPDFFACWKLFDYLTTIRYPEYEKDEKLLWSYNTWVEKILKNSWYRGNDKLSEHAKLYKNFEKEAKKSAEKNTYADSLTYLQQHDAPPSDREEDVKIYLAHMQNVFLYTQDYEKLTNKYGPKMLEWYATTMNSLSALDKKHSWFTDAISRMSAYNKKIEDKKKEFWWISNDTISNYINYTHEAQYLFKKQKALWDVSKRITDEIQGKTKNASMFPEIKKRLSQEKETQKRTDMIRDTIKKISPQSYLTLSLLTWAWNGLVDATIWVWTWLWLLVASLYRDQFATMANAERAQAWTEFLKIGASSRQLEPLVKDGKANVSVDNVSVVMWSGIVNMLVLLSWAWAIGKWISSVGIKVWVNIVEKVARSWWLFARATMQWLPSSFQTYLWAWLDKKTAWSYALNTTLLSSTVEMFAPNDMFFGNPGVMSVIKSLGAKEAAKTLGKEFFKNISKEVGEEIGQETVQMIVEKRIHNHINDKHGTALDSSLTWADFWTTAMVTAMITGVVSGDGSYKMAKNSINKPATVQRICSDQNRYAEYTRKLQQIIAWTNKISWVDYTFASQLLATLESVKQGSVDAWPKEGKTVSDQEENTEPTPEKKRQNSFSEDIKKINSLNSDMLIDENWVINPQAQQHIEQFMRENGVLWANETLTEAQVRKIYEVHTMEREPWEVDDGPLNKRKTKKLNENWLFTYDQRRVLMDGKVCGIRDVAWKVLKNNVDFPKGEKVEIYNDSDLYLVNDKIHLNIEWGKLKISKWEKFYYMSSWETILLWRDFMDNTFAFSDEVWNIHCQITFYDWNIFVESISINWTKWKIKIKETTDLIHKKNADLLKKDRSLLNKYINANNPLKIRELYSYYAKPDVNKHFLNTEVIREGWIAKWTDIYCEYIKLSKEMLEIITIFTLHHNFNISLLHKEPLKYIDLKFINILLSEPWINIETLNVYDIVNLWRKKNPDKIEMKDEIWDMPAYIYKQAFENRKNMLEPFCTLSEKDYLKLFYKNKNKNFQANISQAKVWNCYLIAALHSLRLSPHFEQIIRTSIKQLEDWWSVKIPLWSTEWESIKVTPKDINLQLNKKYFKNIFKDIFWWAQPVISPVWWPIGIKILEAAYTKKVNPEWKLDRLATVWWRSHKALQVLLWSKNTTSKRIDFNRDDVKWISDLFSLLDNAELDKQMINIYTHNHALSIDKIDRVNKKVVITNPWFTKHMKKEYSYIELLSKFENISVVEFNYWLMFTDFINNSY